MSILSGLPKPAQKAFRWDVTAGLLVGLFSGALFPFLGVIARRDLHASAYLIAILTASGSIGNLFNPVVAHYIRDRAKLPFAILPFTVGRLFYFLMPLAVTGPLFIAICFFGSAVTALGSPAYAAVIRDAYPVERRGHLMGMVRVLIVGTTMLGSLAGGLFLAHFSYRWVFPIVALFGILSTAAFSRIGVRAEPHEPAPPGRRLWEAFKMPKGDRSFRLYVTYFYLYGFGSLILGPVIPVFQVDVLKITPQWVGYLATTSAACSMLGYLYWGRILDRHGPFRLMFFVTILLSIMPITYFFAHSVPVLLLAAAASGIAVAGGDLGYVNAAMHFARRDAVVTYAGTFAFLQAMRGIPGPFIGAALNNAIGPRPVFLLALGCWAIATVVMISGGGLRMKTAEANS